VGVSVLVMVVMIDVAVVVRRTCYCVGIRAVCVACKIGRNIFCDTDVGIGLFMVEIAKLDETCSRATFRMAFTNQIQDVIIMPLSRQ